MGLSENREINPTKLEIYNQPEWEYIIRFPDKYY